MVVDLADFESADTRCAASREGVVVLTLTQPRPSISTDVLDAMERALEAAAREGAALVIASDTEHFAWGANLDDALEAAARGDAAPLERALERYQQTMLRLRHATIPTIAAVRGVAISGGCEVLMHCTHVVLHRRCVVGLAEASVGVVPGGGGLKELALRAARAGGDPAAPLEAAFDAVAATRLARGPEEAVQLGWLEPASTTVAADPLVEACRIGVELRSTYRPPASNPRMRVAGPRTAQRLVEKQRRARDAGAIGAHQFEVDRALAYVLTGGNVAVDERDEREMLALEREAFLPLAMSGPTQQRLAHLRETGQVLRN